MKFVKAKEIDIENIIEFYKEVIVGVSKTDVKLGWDINVYPTREWITEAVTKNELVLYKDENEIAACCIVNYDMIEEYDTVNWIVSEPKEKISTIHTFAVNPKYWGKGIACEFLQKVVDYCKSNGDVANHLDVIDSNYKALKTYLKVGFKEIDKIKMFYEAVGTREFWMLEYVF